MATTRATTANATGAAAAPDGTAIPPPVDTPTPTIHQGGQGSFHFSLTADPSNINLMYVGGDRQGPLCNRQRTVYERCEGVVRSSQRSDRANDCLGRRRRQPRCYRGVG